MRYPIVIPEMSPGEGFQVRTNQHHDFVIDEDWVRTTVSEAACADEARFVGSRWSRYIYGIPHNVWRSSDDTTYYARVRPPRDITVG